MVTDIPMEEATESSHTAASSSVEDSQNDDNLASTTYLDIVSVLKPPSPIGHVDRLSKNLRFSDDIT